MIGLPSNALAPDVLAKAHTVAHQAGIAKTEPERAAAKREVDGLADSIRQHEAIKKALASPKRMGCCPA